MSAIFGPAGNAESFPYKSSVDAPRWLAELGLDCYEYQCGKGVNVREETARNIGAAAVAAGIRLSLHAPYFIPGKPRPRACQRPSVTSPRPVRRRTGWGRAGWSSTPAR
ncbi:MAG: hypothetical protein ACLS63_08550 [Flavonifractor plautii]